MKQKLILEQTPQDALPLNEDIFRYEDILRLVVKYVSYKDGLAALRQTCRRYNAFIETLDAGEQARKAIILEPNWVRILMYSVLKNPDKIKKIAPYIGGILGIAGLVDCFNEVNELNIGVNFAISTVKCMSGFTMPWLVFNYSPHFLNLAGAFSFITIQHLLLGLAVSYYAFMISSALRGVFEVPGFDVWQNSYFELAIKYNDLPELFYGSDFQKALYKVMLEPLIAITKYSVMTSAAASIVNMGLFANRKTVRDTQNEQRLIRESLGKPDYHTQSIGAS